MPRCRGVRLALVVSSLILVAANWPQFRGADSRAAAPAEKLPAVFSDQENLLWKAELPGPGASSPIIHGNRVFVTCYSGYGESAQSPGNRSDLVRHLLCLDRKSGQTLWEKEIKTDTREAEYRSMMTQHGYASNTPATDGERVYVFLGTGGVWAFDLEGNKLWQASVGSGTDGWGSGSSVLLADGLVIVNAAVESKAVVALNKADGSQAWRYPISGRSWSTPALVTSPDGRPEVVVSVERKVSGLDPQTGKQLWHCVGIDDYTCPSVVAGEGVAFVSGGRRSSVMAIKTGGEGDVTDTHILWDKVLGGNVTTPALVGEILYGVSDRGIAYAVNAASGEVLYQTRLAGGAAVADERPPAGGPRPGSGRFGRPGFGGPGGFGGGFGGRGGTSLYASVVAGDGKLFAATRTGGVYVLEAGSEYKLLSHNKFTGDDTRFDATPSIADNQLFLRSEKALYCVGER